MAPQSNPRPSLPAGATWAIPLAAVAVLLGLLTQAEKRVYTPYYDIGGILTVCDGITGKDVVLGKTYTDAECDDLGRRYVMAMAAKIGSCVGPLNYGEWIAWGHFTYNVGTPAFCGSTAARLLREGKHEAACRQMPRWRFIGKKDCAIKANRCSGIPKRRALEQGMCLDALR